jgi:hypothetical protein
MLMLALAGGTQAQDLLGQAADWKASASDQVKAELRRDARGICLDYDFGGVSGYAVLRRALPLDWPAHWRLESEWQGRGGRNDVQLKFADASGDNVWWINRPNEQLPAQYAAHAWKPRHLQFAWGPTADKRLRQTAYVEWVVAAGRDGGKGSACLRKLQLKVAEAPPASWPEPQLRHIGAQVLQWELGGLREFNGLLLHWPQRAGLDYAVEASSDGRRWQTLRTVRGGAGGVAPLFLPEQEARALRLRLTQGDTALLRDLRLELRDAAQWPTLNAVLAEQAKSLPRSLLPRGFHGEQNYWALVGVDGGGDRSGLINEDGEIELGRGAPSVAPLLQLEDGALIGWSEVQTRHSLPEGQLPLPTVHWQHPRFALDIQAGADGSPEAPQLLAHYQVTNRGSTPLRARLLLLLRPWQVNPPQQFLSTQGGSSPVAELAWRDGRIWVNGRASLQPQQSPAALRAAPLDAGLGLPQAPLQVDGLRDPQQLASLLLEFPVELAPGATQRFAWAAPLAGGVQPVGDVPSRLSRAEAAWRERLGGVQFEGPAAMQPVIDSLRMAQAHILLSRQGPALRPGTRSYARTWIRDGAMMVAGLTRLGELQVARDFVDWFAPQVFASGKVPCCIDQRGADPVVENDSHGQFIYSVAEVWRHSRDDAWLRSHWPLVRQVRAWMEEQRQKERGPAQAAHLFGLMPPSISHEGYSDKPAYSNWDNFWTLRGYKDAVQIAAALQQTMELSAWTAQRDEFAKELDASLRASAKVHGRDHLLGAADRGDFDPTSTTIALNPVQAQLPPALLAATFERYWQESRQRAAGTREWRDYTPYELRGVGALVQLGQRERAHELLDFFFRDQRPAGWKQWAEVVLPAYREPRFLGDMPHAWVASDYLRSVLDFFALERDGPRPLLLGAGLRAAWLQAGDIAVSGLASAQGPVAYALRRSGAGWRLALQAGQGAALSWPEELPLPRARHAGRDIPWQGRELPLPPAPATVELLP